MSRLVTVARFWDVPEMYVAAGGLRAAGFHPCTGEFYHSTIDSRLLVGLGGVRIQVPEQEAREAAELIQTCREGQAAGGVAGENLEAAREEGLVCPRCQARDYFRLKSWYQSLAFTLFFFVPVAFTTGRLLCRACGHRWRPAEAAA